MILFDRDAETGAVETFEAFGDEEFAIRRRADVQPIIDRNKELANHTDGWNADKTMRHVARIPVEVMYLWVEKYGIRAWDRNHAEGVRRLLNSNEWRYLRTQEIII